MLPYHNHSLPYHTLSPTLSSTPQSSPRLPSPRYSSLNSPPLCYLTLPSHLLPFPIYPLYASAPHPFLTPLPYSPLPSPTIHSPPLILSPDVPYPAISPPQPLPSPPLSPPWLPSCPYPTILCPFLSFPRTPLLCSPTCPPTIPSTPFIPQLTYLPSNLPSPIPLIPSPPSPRLIYLPYSILPSLPALLSPLLPFPCIPSPTYLPSLVPLSYPYIPYPAPLTPVPLHPLSSSTLPYPLPYHIPPDSPAPTLLYCRNPLYYSSLASPTYLLSHPYPTLAFPNLSSLTSLPSYPLPCPLPYHIPPDLSRVRNVSVPTSLSYLNRFLLYPPLLSQHLPFVTHLLPTFPLLYPRIPSTPFISRALIPYPTLPSPLFSHLPLSRTLVYPTPTSRVYTALPKDSKKGNDSQPERSRKRVGPKRLGAESSLDRP